MKAKAIEVLAVLAPDEAVRAGEEMPEGRADRCACCGKRISWRAVVRPAEGWALAFYGLTCAGIRTAEGKRRMRAERLLAVDPEWLAWADGIELRSGTLGARLRAKAAVRPVEVLEAWARAHGATLAEVNFSVLDFGGRDEDLLEMLRSRTYIPKMEERLAELTRFAELGLAEAEEADRERVIVMVLGGTEGFIRRGSASLAAGGARVPAWAPAAARVAEKVIEVLDAVRAGAPAEGGEA